MSTTTVEQGGRAIGKVMAEHMRRATVAALVLLAACADAERDQQRDQEVMMQQDVAELDTLDGGR